MASSESVPKQKQSHNRTGSTSKDSVASLSPRTEASPIGAFGLPIRKTLPGEAELLTAPLSPRPEDRHLRAIASSPTAKSSTSVGAFGLPIRTALPVEPDFSSPREKPLPESSLPDTGPMSAFGLPLRTRLPENTSVRLSAGLNHFDINTTFRVEMGEAFSSHLEILKEMSDMNAELEAAISTSTATLSQSDPDLSNQLSGLLSHQQNLKRYQIQIIDELYTTFVQPYHLLLDPASSTDFARLEYLQKNKDATELLAILELLAANQDHDTITALSSFVAVFSTTFNSAQKSLEGFSKLLSLLTASGSSSSNADGSESSSTSSNPPSGRVVCHECGVPRVDDGPFCGGCGIKV